MLYDGQSVVYQGTADLLQPGDEGRILATEATYSHVLWTTGALAGQTSMHAEDDLEVIGVRGPIEASLDDSLEIGPLTVTSTRQAYDEGGPRAVLEQLAYGGQLSMLRDAAEEGYSLVASRIRSSPYLRHVAAQLDENEVEALVQVTSIALLRELLQGEE